MFRITTSTGVQGSFLRQSWPCKYRLKGSLPVILFLNDKGGEKGEGKGGSRGVGEEEGRKKLKTDEKEDEKKMKQEYEKEEDKKEDEKTHAMHGQSDAQRYFPTSANEIETSRYRTMT